MKLTNIALVPALFVALSAVTGCANDSSPSASPSTTTPGGTADNSGVTLGTDGEQLVSDDTESADTDDTLEAAIDQPLSGADPSDPGTPADGATDDDLLDNVTANAKKHYLHDCLTSTRDGNTIHHVFKACRTNWSLKTFEGTIESTYVRDGNKLTITHEYNGFLADGATISGERVIEYTRVLAPSTGVSNGPSTSAPTPTPTTAANAGVITILKHRTGTFTGETKKGHDLSHTANYSSTYDVAAKCMTREGSAQTTIGGRLFERVLTDYKRCGIGEGGCPESGKLDLTRSNANGTNTLSIDFLGGDKMEITRPNGKVVDRTLACGAAVEPAND